MEVPRARELDLFQAVEGLPAQGLVVIGGYAVSARSIPRYSHDLDIVVDSSQAGAVSTFLETRGFRLAGRPSQIEQSFGGSWERWQRGKRGATIDVLVASVQDREFRVPFPYEWVAERAEPLNLRGLGESPVRLPMASSAMLIALKIQPLRTSDIGDIACLAMAGYDGGELRRLVRVLSRSRPALFERRLSAISKHLAADRNATVRTLGPRIAGPVARRERAARASAELCLQLTEWSSADRAAPG